ncbi:MAG: ABC transporter ATP-binding protein [Clostridiaceae bacterium]|nr:ABC transporter ATP-binding protein [Eubacteriales bacterium]MDD4140332.1 ABC transporter ATP-binding protein [Eubacteriales bacterium]MDD4745117.1 ABC transporter ATP-binding protein [Eubacteriales bacterium]NLB44730.1 ABC transporter ATP-binding protein [Clostridiaceae bacterium]
MIECENLVKIYKTSDFEVLALQGLDLSVARGELMAIIGNSGSGKSTLLNMLGGLDRPSAGRLVVDGHDLLKMTDAQLVQYKRNTVGFIWQNNARNLIPFLTAVQNVEVPMVIDSQHKRRQRALELLDLVGLSKRSKNRLHELSGGEQQRVAIAIALANDPSLLLADEPTGSVDQQTAGMIYDMFSDLNRQLNQTIVIVTHDRQLSRRVNRVVAIRDGRTSSEMLLKQSYLDRVKEIQKLGLSERDVEAESSHEELAVLDKTGRLQLPREYLDVMGIKGRDMLKAEMDGDRIILTKPTEHEQPQATAESAATDGQG